MAVQNTQTVSTDSIRRPMPRRGVDRPGDRLPLGAVAVKVLDPVGSCVGFCSIGNKLSSWSPSWQLCCQDPDEAALETRASD